MSADAGYVSARYRSGVLWSQGRHVQQDLPWAISLLLGVHRQLVDEYQADHRSALAKRDLEQNIHHVKFHLSNAYYLHAFTHDLNSLKSFCQLAPDVKIPGNKEILSDGLEALANKGIPAAQYEYAGILKKEGKIADARVYLQRSANGGCADAQYEYAQILSYNGDLGGHERYIELAAAQQHAAALRHLADPSYDDESVSEDEYAAPASAAAPTAGIKRRRGDG